MKVVRESTAFAAVSELRTRMEEILEQLKETPVILEKHNRPIAVMEDPKRFGKTQQILEAATDLLLAVEARKRDISSKTQEYLSLEEVEKRFL